MKTKHEHKEKKKPHFKRPEKTWRQCQLIRMGIQDGVMRYEPGSIFFFEQAIDQKGQPYMRVYRTRDAESHWPFTLKDFYHMFKILR